MVGLMDFGNFDHLEILNHLEILKRGVIDRLISYGRMYYVFLV